MGTRSGNAWVGCVAPRDEDAAAEPPFGAEPNVVALTEGSKCCSSGGAFRFPGGRPVEVAWSSSSIGFYLGGNGDDRSELLRFDTGVGTSESKPQEAETSVKSTGAVILLQDGPPAPLPRHPTYNTVVWGKKEWKGPADASLEVTGFKVDGGVRLHLVPKDDVLVPVPVGASGQQFVAADHFELWWQPPPEPEAESEGEKPKLENLQLGVGRRADGSVDVRWFNAKVKRPVPAVSWEKDGFDVTLPGSWGKDERMDCTEGVGARFTAVYSDSDAAGGGKSSRRSSPRAPSRRRTPGRSGGCVRRTSRGGSWVQASSPARRRAAAIRRSLLFREVGGICIRGG